MFLRRKQPEIVTIMVAEDQQQAEEVRELLQQAGIPSVIRERDAEEQMRFIVDARRTSSGVEIFVNGDDAEKAAQTLYAAGYFQETEELTDEELEELAMSMEEITGLEDEE